MVTKILLTLLLSVSIYAGSPTQPCSDTNPVFQTCSE